MADALKRRLFQQVAGRIVAAADELTRLDQAIGDGDHGTNMKRGCEAILADLDGLAAKPWNEALKGAGMHLVMKVGGASGPLYGTLLMSFGKSLEDDVSDPARLAAALGDAVGAVKARGKSDVGQKTLLDVWGPVLACLQAAGADPQAVRRAAAEAAEATVPMKAVRGRAAFLGERSIGHMDPGARSSQLMIEAVCDVIEGRA